MKIVVVGGTGLVGTNVVKNLMGRGHEAIAASPKTGVDTISSKGLSEVLKGARVIVDVTGPPSFEEKVVMNFFTASTTNLLRAGMDAGVKHHVALSIVGTRSLPDSSYLRAKAAQENLITESQMPYSIVRATQFFEFFKGLADAATQDDRVAHVPSALIQPMASEEVADIVADISVGTPLNGVVEIAGPDKFRFDEFIRLGLNTFGDRREIVAEKKALYFGTHLDERSLVPGESARLGNVRFSDWLARSIAKKTG
jgi:uncharacterized protein YbjT (DUF2867 family)